MLAQLTLSAERASKSDRVHSGINDEVRQQRRVGASRAPRSERRYLQMKSPRAGLSAPDIAAKLPVRRAVPG